MIYVMYVYRIRSDKVKEYEEIHKAEGIPTLKKHGVKVVGVWKNWLGGDFFEFLRIHAFEDLADYEKKEASQRSDPERQRYLDRVAPLHISHTSRLLRPAEYSPLQ